MVCNSVSLIKDRHGEFAFLPFLTLAFASCLDAVLCLVARNIILNMWVVQKLSWWKRNIYILSKGPVWQMQRLKGTGFKQFEVCLASQPGQLRLHFMNLFALVMATKVGRGHVLVEVKTGKLLLNYFTIKIFVKNLQRNLCYACELAEKQPNPVLLVWKCCQQTMLMRVE